MSEGRPERTWVGLCVHALRVQTLGFEGQVLTQLLTST